MACSSAACVLGGARLISSASRSSVKIGPLVRVKALVWKLNRLVPSKSPGIRSGVNWMRPNLIARLAANQWANSVLAVPGTPSSRMWPLTRRLVSIRSMPSSRPTTALPTSLRIASVNPRMSGTSIDYLPLPLKNIARKRRQRDAAATPAGGQFVGLAQDRAAIDLGLAHRSASPKPLDQRGLRQPGVRAQLPRHIPAHLIRVALDDDRPMARVPEQVRGGLYHAALARVRDGPRPMSLRDQ